MSKRILISVTNDLGNDQRVHRVATTLTEMGFEVCLIGRKRTGSKPLRKRAYKTKRFAYLFESGKLFYLAYAFRMFWWLLFQKADVFWANDMDTLLPNFLVAKLRRKKLVYDSHEYWTEVPELIQRPKTRAIWLWLEKRLFPKVDKAITVNKSIAEIYQKAYGIPVSVLRNLPILNSTILENDGREVSKEKAIIYQGALNVGRGIGLMIDAMRFLPSYQLWIVGYGDVENDLKDHAHGVVWKSQIHFKGFLEPDQLKLLTQKAKLGLSLEEDMGASYHFALPNKLFDYIQAGLPVIVSALPEMTSIVEAYQVGEVLGKEERNAESLAKRIRSICENQDQYQKYSDNSKAAAKLLNWENEKRELESLIHDLLGAN